MTAAAVPADQAATALELCRRYLREPVNEGPPGADSRSFVFTPDLTAEESATLDAILHLAAGSQPMTPTAYAAVRSDMQTLRDLRQLGRSAFMALTAAERDRLTYDAFTATTRVLLAILRDE